MFSTYRITYLFLIRSGLVTKGIRRPIHSKALLLLPQRRPCESLSLVIKASPHFTPPAKNSFSLSKPMEATPLSPGNVKFSQISFGPAVSGSGGIQDEFYRGDGGSQGGRADWHTVFGGQDTLSPDVQILDQKLWNKVARCSAIFEAA